MSRIFFISSNTVTEPYPVYPLGMAIVVRSLQEAGHQVQQYDWLAEGEAFSPLLREIEDFSPDLLSISLRNIDNVDSFSGEDTWYLRTVKNLVTKLRDKVQVPIVIGGPALTIMPEEIRRYIAVDHAIIGEGERALPQLVDSLMAGEAVPQVIQRGEPLAGDEFSSPLFDSKLVDFYLQQSDMVNLQTKRGCPYRCSYCSYPHLEGNNFRIRSPQMVVDELEKLKQEHGVYRIFLTDSVFNDPQGRYLDLVEEMLRRNLNMQWSAFFRPQGFGRDELALMKRAGLYALELGTDATTDQTLAGMNKGMRFDSIFSLNRACIEERLPAAHFIMFGGPDEDQTTLKRGLENMDRLGESVVFAFSGIRIHPNTPLHRRAVDEHIITAETSLLKPIYYFSPLLDREEMEETIKNSFAEQNNRIFPPSEGLLRMSVMRDLGYRGLMWDRLVRFPKN